MQGANLHETSAYTYAIPCGTCSVEFENRLSAGWAKFFELWPLLGRRDACLRKRLLLFDASVSKTVLWCNASWCLTVKQKVRLRTVWRNMLRRFAGSRRHQDEEYVTWIKRSTAKAEETAKEAGLTCWQETHLAEKWMWAGNVATMDEQRWALRTTTWRDSEWWSEQARGSAGYGIRPYRARAGNVLRWEDDFRKYSQAKGLMPWRALARNSSTWNAHVDKFVQFTRR